MQSKKFIFPVLFLLFFGIANGQPLNCFWARGSVAGGNTSYDEGISAATDASGNVYVAGFFQSTTITFGPYTFTKSGSSDLFLVKYDAAGNLLWAISAGGSNTDVASSVAVDPSGNVYLAGWFESPDITFGAYTLTLTGSGNIFLVKYDTNGNVLWAKSSSQNSSGSCWGLSVAADGSGNAYITGFFLSSTITFDFATLTNTGDEDIFIVKYNSAGTVAWAKSASGTGGDRGTSITTDVTGDIYLTGWSNSPTLSFDNYILTNSNIGADFVFLAKFDAMGNVLWTKGSQGEGSTYGFSTGTDLSGNCYITGRFSYAPVINFDSFSLSNINQSTTDIFLVKYSSAGNVLWAKSAGGMGDDCGHGIVTDALKNVYLTGGFSLPNSGINSINFDSTILPFPPGGIDPVFVAKYDSSGNILCAFSIESGGDDEYGFARDASGNLFIGSDYMNSSFILGPDTLSLTGYEDVFVAKFSFKCGSESIDEYNNNEYVLLSPNPFSSETTIKTNRNLNGADLTIYNTFGQEVKSIKNISGQTIKLHRDNLPGGIYFIQLTQESKTIATGKLIITD